MSHVLRELHVPARTIYQDNFSRNTFENIFNAKTIMKKHGWKRAILITSAFHMPRSMREARHAGLAPIPVPCDFHLDSAQHVSCLDFLPDTKCLADNFTALKEYIGILYYRVRY
jgi:uncharacterized SAM-binding protein YcdF (DUF218 family)